MRTPLTLILNPLESESAQTPENQNIATASKNARRLLRPANQLLDFQKLSAGKMQVHLSPLKVADLSVCAEYFVSLAQPEASNSNPRRGNQGVLH